MQNVPTPSQQIFRIDPLIGCNNLVSFCELLVNHFPQQSNAPFSLVSLDVNDFASVNATKGRTYGDAVMRWIGIVLMEEINAPVYRLGGDSLAVALMEGEHAQHAEIAKRAYDRLNREAVHFELSVPVATVTVIHCTSDAQLQPADVWLQLYDAMYDAKLNASQSFMIYQATDLKRADRFLQESLGRMVDRIAWLGERLDQSQQLAFTDPVTGLPNVLAAVQALDAAIAQAQGNQSSFAVLMIDGDNLRAYNDISYAVGDEMILALARTLSSNLRPGDFLARWRSGDEFLIILPKLNGNALTISERFCTAVEQASRQWRYPVTISIGVAVYPNTGNTRIELLDQAEAALKCAKDAGKNRSMMAE